MVRANQVPSEVPPELIAKKAVQKRLTAYQEPNTWLWRLSYRGTAFRTGLTDQQVLQAIDAFEGRLPKVKTSVKPVSGATRAKKPAKSGKAIKAGKGKVAKKPARTPAKPRKTSVRKR
jgi:hypothetical protein